MNLNAHPTGMKNKGDKNMNEKTKKILPILLVTALVASTFVMSAYAGTTDTFTVTVRGKYLDIQVNVSTWSINSDASIDMSSTHWSNVSDAAPFFTAILFNNSVATDLKLHVSSDGADWTVGDAAGADTYVINATHDLWVTPAECINLTDGAVTLKAGISIATNQTFDLRFEAPSSTTSGDLQTITITATVAEN